MKLLAILSALALLAYSDAKKQSASDGNELMEKQLLKRVVLLARHGNRTPNRPTLDLCPAYKNTLAGFGPNLSPGQLTSLGMVELYEAGSLIRKLYSKSGKGFRKGFLPDVWQGDKTFYFSSERAERNLVSSQAFIQGMFPAGTGPEGFLKSRPWMIPIQSTTEGLDDLYNNPRDGKCIPRNVLDAKKANQELLDSMNEDDIKLIKKLSDACKGADLLQISEVSNGKYNIGSASKIIMDALLFARTEGLDNTLNGGLSRDDSEQLRLVGHKWMMKNLFNSNERVTVWAGDMPNKLISLFDITNKTGTGNDLENQKFHFMLAHRELIYALSLMLNLDIRLPNVPAGYVPAGSSLQFEVYTYRTYTDVYNKMVDNNWQVASTLQDIKNSTAANPPRVSLSAEDDANVRVDVGVDLFFWRPSGLEASNSHGLTGQALKEAKERMLNEYGERIRIELPRCKGAEICPFDAWKAAFEEYVGETQTWEVLCNEEEVKKLSSSVLINERM